MAGPGLFPCACAPAGNWGASDMGDNGVRGESMLSQKGGS